MTKRKVSFAMLACLVVAMVVLMALPMAASAAIDSVQWSGAAFMGYDDFYNANVVAFKAGATATLTARVTNATGLDVTITEAKIKFDWGGVFPATTAPTQLKNGETGIFVFQFTVPEVTVATNSAMHAYTVIVGYQEQGPNYVVNRTAGDFLGFGNGVNKDFGTTGGTPVLASSLVVTWVDSATTPATVTTKDSSTYVLNARTGLITFGAAPAATVSVYADYQYFEDAGDGNGVNKVFYTDESPIKDGTLKVYIGNGTAATFVEAAGWTADLETGKITLASAPNSFETVWVTYEYWDRWPTWGGTDFVVFSADQADAVAAGQKFDDMDNEYPNYLFTPGTAAAKAREEANVSADKAAAEYENGDFAGAKADYTAAVTSLQAAIEADNTLNTSVETALTGLLSNANGVVDAYANKLNAEAKQANGEASMYKNVGVFTILLGVATLLAGLGGILWAYSRLVAARAQRTQ